MRLRLGTHVETALGRTYNVLAGEQLHLSAALPDYIWPFRFCAIVQWARTTRPLPIRGGDEGFRYQSSPLGS